jgi:hypothetical protein
MIGFLAEQWSLQTTERKSREVIVLAKTSIHASWGMIFFQLTLHIFQVVCLVTFR